MKGSGSGLSGLATAQLAWFWRSKFAHDLRKASRPCSGFGRRLVSASIVSATGELEVRGSDLQGLGPLRADGELILGRS